MSALSQRVFAWGCRHLSRKHRALLADRQAALFETVTGRVLEVGCGPANNLPFLPAAVDWTGIDGNPFMLRYAAATLAKYGRRGRVIQMDAHDLAFPDASFDSVVCTLVLCSVADPGRVLAEMRRVLRPGGHYHFIEHVAATAGTPTRRWQRRTRPIWRCIGDGCEPDRETGATITRAGFSDCNIEPFDLPVPVFGPHIAGRARR